jgi:hypothetical protein
MSTERRTLIFEVSSCIVPLLIKRTKLLRNSSGAFCFDEYELKQVARLTAKKSENSTARQHHFTGWSRALVLEPERCSLLQPPFHLSLQIRLSTAARTAADLCIHVDAWGLEIAHANPNRRMNEYQSSHH